MRRACGAGLSGLDHRGAPGDDNGHRTRPRGRGAGGGCNGVAMGTDWRCDDGRGSQVCGLLRPRALMTLTSSGRPRIASCGLKGSMASMVSMVRAGRCGLLRLLRRLRMRLRRGRGTPMATLGRTRWRIAFLPLMLLPFGDRPLHRQRFPLPHRPRPIRSPSWDWSKIGGARLRLGACRSARIKLSEHGEEVRVVHQAR